MDMTLIVYIGFGLGVGILIGSLLTRLVRRRTNHTDAQQGSAEHELEDTLRRTFEIARQTQSLNEEQRSTLMHAMTLVKTRREERS